MFKLLVIHQVNFLDELPLEAIAEHVQDVFDVVFVCLSQLARLLVLFGGSSCLSLSRVIGRGFGLGHNSLHLDQVASS